MADFDFGPNIQLNDTDRDLIADHIRELAQGQGMGWQRRGHFLALLHDYGPKIRRMDRLLVDTVLAGHYEEEGSIVGDCGCPGDDLPRPSVEHIIHYVLKVLP